MYDIIKNPNGQGCDMFQTMLQGVIGQVEGWQRVGLSLADAITKVRSESTAGPKVWAAVHKHFNIK